MHSHKFLALLITLAVLLGLGLFFFGPPLLKYSLRFNLNAGNVNATTTVPYTIIAHGANALSVRDQANYRITSQVDLILLWQLVYGEVDTAKAPKTDFTKYDVLAVFDGTHYQAKYDVGINAIEDRNATRTIRINRITLPSSCTSYQEISPFVIVTVPKSTFPLAHQDVPVQGSCP